MKQHEEGDGRVDPNTKISANNETTAIVSLMAWRGSPSWRSASCAVGELPILWSGEKTAFGILTLLW